MPKWRSIQKSRERERGHETAKEQKSRQTKITFVMHVYFFLIKIYSAKNPAFTPLFLMTAAASDDNTKRRTDCRMKGILFSVWRED